MNILFVCLGNICRSPLAEGIFRHHVATKGLQHAITCDSAGTVDYHAGSLPDHRTRRNAKSHGIELTHKARLFQKKDPDEYDLILVMDKSNEQNVLNLVGEKHRHKVMLMRHFDETDKGGEVPDPYYGGDAEFEEVFQILHRSCDNFLNYLISEKLIKV